MIRILIADADERDHGDLAPRLAGAEGVVVVGRARDGHEALALARALRPDVFLLSSLIAGMDGIEVTRQVVAEGVAGAVLVLTAEANVGRSHDALHMGAAGVLPRETPRDDLVQAIRSAVPERTAQIVAAQAASEDPFRGLTDREREVLALVAEGYSNKEIASQLGLTVGTVKGYVSSLLTKLGVADRTQAAVFALRHGLINPDS